MVQKRNLVMIRKGNLAVFEGSDISKKGEAMATKIGVHALHINACLHEFFEPIPIVHGPKGKFGRF